jgi:hypothetical protein
MPDDHVLRIADERGHAADICASRERDEKREQWQLSAPDNRHHKRCEHQANRVVHQQGGEDSRSERDV